MNELTAISVAAPSDSPLARAARVKRIRKLMALSTEELARLLGYSRQTLSFWENADKEGGLSDKGAARLAEVARNQGIQCDARWLLFGLGEVNIGPLRTEYDIPMEGEHKTSNIRKTTQIAWIQNEVAELQANIQFYKEIEAFLNNSDTAVVALIKDESMEPVYEKGDWVGGHLTEVSGKLNGKICIVNLNQSPQVRLIKSNKSAKKFTVSYLKKAEETADFQLKNISIKEAAQIVRFWRK